MEKFHSRVLNSRYTLPITIYIIDVMLHKFLFNICDIYDTISKNMRPIPLQKLTKIKENKPLLKPHFLLLLLAYSDFLGLREASFFSS